MTAIKHQEKEQQQQQQQKKEQRAEGYQEKKDFVINKEYFVMETFKREVSKLLGNR